MNRFKRILVPTDFSPESSSTIRYAAHLAKMQNAKLTILHVPPTTTLIYPYYELPIDTSRIDREVEEDAKKRLSRLARQLSRSGAPTDLVLRCGFTHDVICEVAREIHASIIVMATHGRKGIGHALLGSVTERVLHDSPCPVLVVRPPQPVIHARKAA
jgi:nucleotide-binding universal stress UspA family protein